MFRTRRSGGRPGWLVFAAVAGLVTSLTPARAQVELESLWSHDTGG